MRKKRGLVLFNVSLVVLLFLLFLNFQITLGQKTEPDIVPAPEIEIKDAGYRANTFVAPVHTIERRAPLAIDSVTNFDVTYTGFTPEAQAAFQYAVDIWARQISSTQTIYITATWTTLSPGTLGSAGSEGLIRNFPNSVPDTFYSLALAEKLCDCNLNGSNFDIRARFNDTTNWYYGLDGNPGPGQHDLVTVVMHEIGHGLGFSGFMRFDDGSAPDECAGVANEGCWGGGTPVSPSIYDRFTEDNNAISLLNTATYPNPSLALGSVLLSEDLYFNGTNAIEAAGGVKPKLYAPSSWDQGSSYAHLDENTYVNGDLNSLMTPQLATEEAIHDPGQITLCMFEDMGWKAKCNPNAIWDNGGLTSDWSEDENWSRDLAPEFYTNVIFNNTDVSDAIIDAAFPGDIASLTVDSSYTGNIAQTVDLDVFGDFNQNGGTYVATAGTLAMKGSGSDTLTLSNGALNDVQIGDGTNLLSVDLGSDLDVNSNLDIMAYGSLLGGSRTIQVGGNWSDYGSSFNPGMSTVVFDGATQGIDKFNTVTIPLSEDFSDYDSNPDGQFVNTPPIGWSTIQNGDGAAGRNTWWFGDFAPFNGVDNGFSLRWYDGATIIDSWLISPELILSDVASYELEFRHRVTSFSDPQDLSVYIGSSPNPSDMTQLIWSQLDAANTNWMTEMQTFQVPSSGTYYLGFRTEDASAGSIGGMLDDIVLTAYNDLQFYDLIISSTNAATVNSDLIVNNNLTVNSGGRLNIDQFMTSVEGSVTNNGTLSQTIDPMPAGVPVDFLHIQNAVGDTDKYYGVTITPTLAMGQTAVGIRGNSNCTSDDPGDTVNRCFEIAPSNSVSSDIRFYYLTSEEDSQDPANMLVFHWLGSKPWEAFGADNVGTVLPDYNWVEASGIDNYSPFVLSDAVPTAVTLNALSISTNSIMISMIIGIFVLLTLLTIFTLHRRKQPG